MDMRKKLLSAWFVCLVMLAQGLAFSQSETAQRFEAPAQKKFLAQIELSTFDELNRLLKRSEQLFNKGDLKPGRDTPVAFVLHGPEARLLLQNHYFDNQQLVDLAAKLSAFQVVDIRVCETWMGNQKIDQSQLPPFIGTVPFGPAETRRLLEQEAYVYF